MLTYDKKIALEKQVGFFQIELDSLQKKKEAAKQQKDRLAQQETENQIWEITEALQPLQSELQSVQIDFPHLIGLA
jgi:hypothetical protein